MKVIVVYRSGTGFTERYARWIAEELNCEVVKYQKSIGNQLSDYDMVIYGGPIMAGMVNGYDKIREKGLKNLIVFGVGMSAPGEKVTEEICTQNKLAADRFFYFEGGYTPERLGIFQRLLMGMIRKSIEQKTEKTAEDLHMLESFRGADRTDRQAIAPLITLCREETTM